MDSAPLNPSQSHRSAQIMVVLGCVTLSLLVVGGRRAKTSPSHTEAPAILAAYEQPEAVDPSAANRPMELLASTNVTPSPDTARAPAAEPELLHEIVPADAPVVQTAAAVLPAGPAVAAPAKTRVLWLEVTAYCSCKKCCGPKASGITATGRHVSYNGGLFVAADTKLLPFGTQLVIPGYAHGQPVEVIDRGSAIKGHHIDLYFASHEQAKAWGRKWLAVTVVAE